MCGNQAWVLGLQFGETESDHHEFGKDKIEEMCISRIRMRSGLWQALSGTELITDGQQE